MNSVIGGGMGNMTRSDATVVSGGEANSVLSGFAASITGGSTNTIGSLPAGGGVGLIFPAAGEYY